MKLLWADKVGMNLFYRREYQGTFEIVNKKIDDALAEAFMITRCGLRIWGGRARLR